MIALVASVASAEAQTIYSYNTTTLSPTWTTPGNWIVGGVTSTKFPGDGVGTVTNEGTATDIAAFGATASGAANIQLNFNTAGGVLTLGAIDFTSGTTRDTSIGNSSASASQTNAALTLGGQTLNSVANTILSNEGTKTLTLQTFNGGSTAGMSVVLNNATNNVVQITNTGGITISSVVKDGLGTKLTLQGGGSGAFTLSGANTFSGGVTASTSGNILQLGTSGAVSGGAIASGPVGKGTRTLGGGATLRSDGSSARSIQNNVSLSGSVILGAASTQTGTLTFNSTDGTNALTTASTAALTGNTALTTNVTTTFNNAITGGFDLTKTGAGTLNLSGANSFSGTFSGNVGTTNLNVDGALGSVTAVVVGDGALVQSSGTGTTNVINDAASVTLNGAGTMDLRGGAETVGSLTGASTTSSLAIGDYSGTAGSFTVGDGSSTTFAGVISGSRATAGAIFTKQGSGTLILSGANTYTGTTSIQNGALQLVGGNDRLATTGTIVLGGTSTSGKLILGNSTSAANQTLAGLTATGGGGSVVGGNATTASVLTTNIASGTNTYSGVLGGANATENNLALSKTGSGALVLTGNNTYAGGTTISAGSVTAGSSTALGTGTVTLATSLYGTANASIANNIVLNGTVTTSSAYTSTYNFTTTSPSSTTGSTSVTAGTISQGNNNGTTTFLDSTSASSGYTGASGGNNGALATRIGALATGSGGSAYVEFTLTPAQASTFSLSSISFGSRSTGTGPANFTLRSSLDSYGSDLATGSLSTGSSWSLYSGAPSLTSTTGGSAITFRLYGYGGAGNPTTGTANWRLDDLALGGNVFTQTTGAATLGSQSTSGTTTYSGTITLNGNALLASASGGTVAVTGNLVESGGSYGITKTDAGIVSLSGANTFTGATAVSAGTLTLAATGPNKALGTTSQVTVSTGGILLLASANQVNIAAPISLAGGTIQKAASSDQGTTSSVGLGALTLTAASTLDYTQTAGTLTFTGFTPGGNVLSITGYIGDGTNSGNDHLVFNQDESGNLNYFNFGPGTGSSFIGQANLGGGYYEIYSLVPVPEPATVFGGMLLVGALGWSQRRRVGGWAVATRRRVMGLAA